MSPIREAWRRFGTPDAISWPAFIVSFAAGLLGNLVTNATPVSLVLRLPILIVAQFAMWIPLAVTWLVLRRSPRHPRPMLVLASLLLGLAARGLVIGAAFSIHVGPEHAQWGDRLWGAILNVGLAFAVTAVLVTAMRERRTQIVELKDLQAQLAVSVERVAAGFSERNDETVERVRQVLIDALGKLDSADAGQSLAALQYTAADVVRPLSHDLAQALPRPDGHDLVATRDRVTWLEIVDEAATGRPFRPALTGLVLAFECLGGIVGYPPGAKWLVPAVPITMALLWLANVPLAHWLRHGSRLFRVVSVIAVAILVASIVGGGTRAVLGSTPPVPAIAIALTFFVLVFSLGATVVSVVARDRDGVIRELQTSARALERSLVRWRQAQWFQQKALSRALHGPIQMAVNAAAIRLDAAMRTDEVEPLLIEQVRTDLLESLDVLHQADGVVASFDEGLDRIVGTWDGLCAIEVDVELRVAAAVAADAVLRSCVLDMVTEAVSNTIRHGGATHVAIHMECAEEIDEAMRLRVRSDGAAFSGTGQRGLGSQLLDDCTIEWERGSCTDDQCLTAVLPLPAA